MQSKPNPSPPENGLLVGKLVHLALPVRWTPMAQQGRGTAEMACTYDIHPHGARLLSAREVSVGDLVMVERGRSKAVCQVVWTADPSSPLRGQFTVQCAEGSKTPWDDELRLMEEQYQPVTAVELPRNSGQAFSRATGNRRRHPRFYVEGQAEVVDGLQRMDGALRQISEGGARIATSELLTPGTEFRLMLNVFDVSVALKAQVKSFVENLGMGVEFQEIRRGDRPLLNYVLGKLRTRKVEEFPEVEVVADPMIAAAG